jgi:sugar transferase (PEP-CTERM/EpsH1 system associated)
VQVVNRTRAQAERASLRGLLSRRPLSVAAYDCGELHRLVEASVRAAPPDVVLVYTAVMAPYARHARAPKLLDFVDADSEKWTGYGERLRPPRSILYAMEGRRLAAFELESARSFERCAFVSPAEARTLLARLPELRYTVIPNGVDLEYFRPPAEGRPSAGTGVPVLLFVGVMDYFPNSDAAEFFAREVLPLVRERVPGTEFRIVGRQPSAAVRALGQLPGVSVTGAVPDVRPHLAEATLSVAPFRISHGIPNKVLEAMAAGLPVVGTPKSFQALEAGAADGLHCGGTPEALAQEIVALLRDPAARSEAGARARRYVERSHRWEAVGDLLEATLQGLA